MVASSAPIDPVTSRVLSALNPACGPISRNQPCIRSITSCLYPNFASILQRATIMIVLLESCGNWCDRYFLKQLAQPSAWRHDTNHRLLAIPEAHLFIESMCPVVVSHDMQERYFVALHLATDQLGHQPARETAALKVRMRAYATYLAERSGTHA